MGRRRKIFTKREYEKLSKTFEGRQKIKRTYCLMAIAYAAIAAVIMVVMILLELRLNLGPSIILGIGFFFGFAILIALIIAAYYFYEMKKEQKEEAERLRQEAIIKKKEEERALAIAFQQKKDERDRINRLKESNINAVDYMNGVQFEEFVSAILEDLGYITQKTKATGDFGADLIIKKDGEEAVVQCKRYVQKVSVSAVQEITSAKSYYGVLRAWVITNSYFTHPAKELAMANNVRLIDRDELIDLILKAKKARTAQEENT